MHFTLGWEVLTSISITHAQLICFWCVLCVNPFKFSIWKIYFFATDVYAWHHFVLRMNEETSGAYLRIVECLGRRAYLTRISLFLFMYYSSPLSCRSIVLKTHLDMSPWWLWTVATAGSENYGTFLTFSCKSLKFSTKLYTILCK